MCEMILSLHVLVVHVLSVRVLYSLLSNRKLEVLLCCLYDLRLERSLNVVFLLYESLTIHDNLAFDSSLHLSVKVSGLIESALSLLDLSLLFEKLSLSQLLPRYFTLQVESFGLFHIDIEVHLSQLISCILHSVPWLIQLVI